ncbi:unnamed protein product [Prunus armeniaca]|uniref:GST C-terminal domain-containing protein n=1 Tax=Prunus armeniaca TaxID=36596 RepID=A0A6J5X9N6_PRUAR|nr:unnamed protein product [Prunus armeniaca]
MIECPLKREFLECTRLLEEELGDKPYLGRGNLGFVEVALIPTYSWFYVREKFGNFSVEAKHPKFIAWTKRCMQKESVSRSLHDQKRVYESCAFGVNLEWSRWEKAWT